MTTFKWTAMDVPRLVKLKLDGLALKLDSQFLLSVQQLVAMEGELDLNFAMTETWSIRHYAMTNVMPQLQDMLALEEM